LADEELVFPTEEIPDSDSVFMRAHRNLMRDGEIGRGVFTAHGGAMSVDWDKYSSAEATRKRGAKGAENYAVIKMAVIGIRHIRELDVKHSPMTDNRAHSDINLPEDEDLTEVRLNLGRIATVVIPIES
jgi:hypothetical protein